MKAALALLAASVGHASPDYQASLENLRASQERMKRELRAMGVETARPVEGAAAQETLLPVRIPIGKLLFGRLVNKLVVGGDGSPAVIELDADQGRFSGLRAFGQARQAGAPGRVALEFQHLRLRDGRAVKLQGVGLDSEGAYGLSAQVLGGKALSVVGSIAASFVSGLAAGQQTSNGVGFGPESTGRNGLLQGVAQSAGDQSKRMIEESTAERPVLLVDALEPLTLYVQEEARW